MTSNEYIQYVDIWLNYKDRLLNGKIVDISYNELIPIIKNINFMGINTLMIQQSDDGYYIKVDDKTVEYYKRKCECNED